MKESKSMLEIRKIRDKNAEETKSMTITEKIDYLFKKGEKARENLNLKPTAEYDISQKDLYGGAVSENTTEYEASKESD